MFSIFIPVSEFQQGT